MMIRTREQLLDWLQDNAPRPCIRRAIREGGSIENFGGFVPVRPGKYSPGWIVKISSRFGKRWFVGVWYNKNNKLITDILDTVNWKDWAGHNAKNPLYTGDHPESYLLWT